MDGHLRNLLSYDMIVDGEIWGGGCLLYYSYVDLGLRRQCALPRGKWSVSNCRFGGSPHSKKHTKHKTTHKYQ